MGGSSVAPWIAETSTRKTRYFVIKNICCSRLTPLAS